MPKRRPRNYAIGLPNALRRMRLSSGYNLNQAAAKIGMEPENIRKRETGETHLRVREVEKFARAYGCSVADILAQAPDLAAQEQTLLQLFRGLSLDQQETLIRICGALLLPAAAQNK
jgi:transcriptional regulator with XRE-family HTH domain